MGLSFLSDLSVCLFPFEAGLTNASESVAPHYLHSLDHAFVYHAQDGIGIEVAKSPVPGVNGHL